MSSQHVLTAQSSGVQKNTLLHRMSGLQAGTVYNVDSDRLPDSSVCDLPLTSEFIPQPSFKPAMAFPRNYSAVATESRQPQTQESSSIGASHFSRGAALYDPMSSGVKIEEGSGLHEDFFVRGERMREYSATLDGHSNVEVTQKMSLHSTDETIATGEVAPRVTPRPRLWAGDGEAAKPRAGVSLASQAAGCFADVAKSCVSDSAGQGQSVVETKALASGGAFTCKRVPVRQLPETEPPPGAAGFFSYSKSITPRGTEAGTLGSRFRSAVTSDPSLSNRARLDANNHIAALRYQRSSSSGVGMSHSNITQYDSWRNRILWLTRMQRGSPRRSSSYSFVRAPSRRVTPEAVAQHFPHSIVNGCEQEDLIRFVDAYNTPSRRQGYEASDPQSVTAGLRQSCEGVYHPLSVTSMPYHNGVPSAAYRLLDPVEKRNNGTLACASLSQLEECQKRLERQRLIINLERKCRSRRHVEK